MRDDGFLTYLLELLHPLGAVRHRRMFGGVGIYCDDVMFALTFEEQVFLRAQVDEQALFEERGMGPFTYEAQGKIARIASYWQMPPELMDEPDELILWARRAVVAAHENKQSKAKKSAAKTPRRAGSPSKSTSRRPH
jgi:DNA transformation protein